MSDLFKPSKLTLAIMGGLCAAVQANAQVSSTPLTTQGLPTVVLEGVSVSGVGRVLQTTPASITTINADEINQISARDMAQIVKYQPLVSADISPTGSASIWDSSGTMGINIRGMDGNRVGLDVDGVELPAAASRPDGMSNNSYGVGRDYIDPA